MDIRDTFRAVYLLLRWMIKDARRRKYHDDWFARYTVEITYLPAAPPDRAFRLTLCWPYAGSQKFTTLEQARHLRDAGEGMPDGVE